MELDIFKLYQFLAGLLTWQLEKLFIVEAKLQLWHSTEGWAHLDRSNDFWTKNISIVADKDI